MVTERPCGALAARVHPLFATRGVPGTHDLGLLSRTLDALLAAGPDARTPLPRFDKLADDPIPQADWPVQVGRPDLILVDGWCIGARAQSGDDLRAPINELERDEDPAGIWRAHVNAQLAGPYRALWDRFDAILFLQAPGFDVVSRWRRQQEETALGRALTEPEAARIDRFVRHFERITRAMLAGDLRAEVTVRLAADRRVLGWTASGK